MAVVLPWEHSVCEECFNRNAHAIWLVKYKCFERRTHRRGNIRVIIDKENVELVRVRPPPSAVSTFRGQFYMCNYVGACHRGNSCKYAHSELELNKWNTIKSVLGE